MNAKGLFDDVFYEELNINSKFLVNIVELIKELGCRERERTFVYCTLAMYLRM